MLLQWGTYEWNMKSHRTLTLIEAWKRGKLLSAKQA